LIQFPKPRIAEGFTTCFQHLHARAMVWTFAEMLNTEREFSGADGGLDSPLSPPVTKCMNLHGWNSALWTSTFSTLFGQFAFTQQSCFCRGKLILFLDNDQGSAFLETSYLSPRLVPMILPCDTRQSEMVLEPWGAKDLDPSSSTSSCHLGNLS
jgi:hypothetical protein